MRSLSRFASRFLVAPGAVSNGFLEPRVLGARLRRLGLPPAPRRSIGSRTRPGRNAPLSQRAVRIVPSEDGGDNGRRRCHAVGCDATPEPVAMSMFLGRAASIRRSATPIGYHAHCRCCRSKSRRRWGRTVYFEECPFKVVRTNGGGAGPGRTCRTRESQ